MGWTKEDLTPLTQLLLPERPSDRHGFSWAALTGFGVLILLYLNFHRLPDLSYGQPEHFCNLFFAVW